MIFKETPAVNQICQCYFYMSSREIDEMLAQMKRKESTTNELGISGYEEFESFYLLPKLGQMKYITFGDYNVKYFSQLQKGKPLLGSVTICVMPDAANIALPRAVPNDLIKELPSTLVDDILNKVALKNNMYDLEIVDKVDDESFIIYDLRYLKNNFVINTIEDQDYDMAIKDSDINPELLKNVKVGDVVILNQDEDFTIEAIIKSIHHRVPRELTDQDLSKIDCPFDVKTIVELRKIIMDIIQFKYALDSYSYFILEFTLQNSSGIITEDVIDFFINNVMLIEEEIDDELMDKIKREIALECIDAIINYNYDYEDMVYDFSSEQIRQVSDISSLAVLMSEIDEELENENFKSDIKKYKLIRYCIDNKIVRNIKL